MRTRNKRLEFKFSGVCLVPEELPIREEVPLDLDAFNSPIRRGRTGRAGPKLPVPKHEEPLQVCQNVSTHAKKCPNVSYCVQMCLKVPRCVLLCPNVS
jgi:hypothetical protein